MGLRLLAVLVAFPSASCMLRVSTTLSVGPVTVHYGTRSPPRSAMWRPSPSRALVMSDKFSMPDMEMPAALKDLKGKLPADADSFIEEYASTAAIFGACFLFTLIAAPSLIDNIVTVLAFPAVALYVTKLAPLLDEQLSSRGISSKAFTPEESALVTTTATILALKIVSTIF
eukprot:CAMPEP_0185186654 /NCGR_PEP_ID=MMETSP1140-20130426/4201_1 /TAXON_ID=298111 /ORGANISM="Pavlova sp., Strain CCMP459" /LENGTH=171 /DNA_ID=CAMNT_0027752969 /DNA_START=26 /DNA_END=541 /DNA_ORIENTATION=-